MVQLSHPCMTTGKTIALTRQTLSAKRCLCFLVCCHSFPSKEQASFNFMAVVTVCCDFEAQENIYHCFHVFLFCLPWRDGTGCHDLNFLNVEFEASFFPLLFHLHQETLDFLFAFCRYSGIITILTFSGTGATATPIFYIHLIYEITIISFLSSWCWKFTQKLLFTFQIPKILRRNTLHVLSIPLIVS